MAASLSEDEFQRLQSQLIELKSTNYTLEERCQKLSNELAQVCSRNEVLDREYAKVQKAFTKSKKAQDVDQLLQENENLTRKLQNQEDEFRLQNTTLMQELMRLDTTNEELRKDVEALRSEAKPDTAQSCDQELLRRLQAENAALQKSLADSRTSFEKEITSLKADRDSNLEPSGREDVLNQQILELEEIKLKLYTEAEEKNILREQLGTLESALKDELNKLQQEHKKQSEKLKKKQESILQLQEEKESLFSENKLAIESLEKEKVQETEKSKEQVQRLQGQLDQAQQTLSDLRTSSQAEVDALKQRLAHHKDQADLDSQKASEEFTSQCQSLQLEVEVLKSSLDENRTEHQLLQVHFEDAQNLLKKMKEELQSCQEQKTKAEEAAAEAIKMAEKRKSLLDSMAIHLQETTDKHNAQLNRVETELRNQVASLQIELDLEKEKSYSLHQLELSFKSQESVLSTLESSNVELRQALEREREASRRAQDKAAEEAAIKEQEYQAELLQGRLDHSQEVMLLTAQLEEARIHSGLLENQVEKLKQDIKDGVEERKIQEKKGLSMVKELKKQLAGERKRCDKLQERLQEILSDTSSGKIEDILPVGSFQEKPKGDASSVSSWSFMSTHLDSNKDGGIEDADNRLSSHEGSPNGTTDHDYSDLLQRVAALQQEKWILEEKLNHLEVSNSAMAEDIMAKTAVIQFYCMEGRPDSRVHSPVSQKLTVKRVVDFIKDKGDESLKDINRKLQRMLEETLTKNMYLQKDLENMSNQLVQVSKLAGHQVANCDSPAPSESTTSVMSSGGVA